MPEIARFFGIIIRMFAEPASPHHRPHLHAYYQDDVGIFAIDTVELIAVIYLSGSVGSWKRGPRFISLSCSPPGTGCRQVGRRARSSPFDRR